MSQAPSVSFEAKSFVEGFVRGLGYDPDADLTAAPGTVGGADYCIAHEGRTAWFIAVSPLSAEAAFRLRRYAWSAKVPMSVLLTPDALTILDCGARPSLADDPSRLILFTCGSSELGDRAGEIRKLLSPEAVAQRSLLSPARRVREVEEAFVEHIDDCRRRLGRDGAAIEAMVFARFREDRGMDGDAGSSRTAEHTAIARDLYYPDCPFEFSVLSPDVLGRLHEREMATEKTRQRKTSGVYYTPEPVVRYVAASTIGPLLEGKTPQEAAQIRVLDPACGSGSFLLGAFQYILRWHHAWYLRHDPELHARGDAPALFSDARGCWQLTSAKRREILQGSVFGVDLDPHAVELTKLALGLETAAGDGFDRLPDLDGNIRCGNSLLGNAFDYPESFPRAFEGGGFDAVIGNPPYLSFGGRQTVEISKTERAYFDEHYECAGWSTAHSLFMERSAKDLSRRLLSFIVPDQVGHLEGYRSLRELLAREGGIREVKYWGEKIFKEAVTPSLTFVFDKQRPSRTTIVDQQGRTEEGSIARGDPWTFSSSRKLLEKLHQGSMSIRPYLADCGVRTTHAKSQVVELAKASGSFVAALEGKQIGRYWCAPPEIAVRLDTPARVFVARDHKYASAKFLIRQTAAYPIVGPREHVTHFRNSLHALYSPDDGSLKEPSRSALDVRYLVGLLNSKLLRFAYVATIREASQRVFPQVKLGPLGTLPIRSLDLASAGDREKHDGLVELVEAMLAAQRRLRGDARNGDAVKAEVRELDAQIDRKVFRLYELTDPEVAQVEAAIDALAPPP